MLGLAIALGTGIAMFAAGRIVRRGFRKKLGGDPIALNVTARITQVFTLLAGIEVFLHAFDIRLTTLLAAGGVAAIGVGFAAKAIVENFLAGVSLRLDQTIRRGDVIELEGQQLTVRRIGIRTTTAETFDDEEVIVPNATLAHSTIVNLTRHSTLYRVRANVGVAYESDLKLVRKTLEDCIEGLAFRSDAHPSLVILEEFAASSVNYSCRVWVKDANDSLTCRSSLHEAIWWALKDAGIGIPYPQLDVHVDGPLSRGPAPVDGGEQEPAQSDGS